MPVETPTREGQRTEVEPSIREITQMRARLMASAVNLEFLKPDRLLSASEAAGFKERFTQITPKDINYLAAEKASLEDRQERWRGTAFELANQRWNSSVSALIQNSTQSENPNREETIKALQTLGIDWQNQATIEGGLSQEVEKFRQNFFRGENSLENFITVMADSCKEDGGVNLLVFEKRLNSIKGLLGSFGKSLSIQKLVQDYASTHIHVDQKAEVKAQVADLITPLISQAMPENNPDYSRLKIIATSIEASTPTPTTTPAVERPAPPQTLTQPVETPTPVTQPEVEETEEERRRRRGRFGRITAPFAAAGAALAGMAGGWNLFKKRPAQTQTPPPPPAETAAQTPVVQQSTDHVENTSTRDGGGGGGGARGGGRSADALNENAIYRDAVDDNYDQDNDLGQAGESFAQANFDSTDNPGGVREGEPIDVTVDNAGDFDGNDGNDGNDGGGDNGGE